MKELQDSVEKIQIKRRELRTAMNQNHDPLIHKFPPEIASHIFVQCAPTSAFFDENSKNWGCPLYLGAVCQKWRQLAWATPQLWSSLRIGLRSGSYGFRRNSEVLPELVTEWLERSANLPLTIDFNTNLLENSGDNAYSEVIDALNNHSARWHEIHFDVSARLLRRLCGSSQRNILQKLALSHLTRTTQTEPNAYDFSMICKPSPTHLTLSNFSVHSVDILWSSITVASLRAIGIDECIELLRRSPHLESLALIEIRSSSGVFPIPDTRISCPHLQSLELSDISDEITVDMILDSIHVPALEKWTQDRCPLSLDGMLSIARSSSFCLKEFRLRGQDVAYDNIHNLLRHLSSLQVLQLQFNFLHRRPKKKLIDLLCTSEGDSPPFLPHLQSFELILEFCFSWFGSGSLRVNADHECHLCIADKIARRLQELVGEEGFDLSTFQDGENLLKDIEERPRCV